MRQILLFRWILRNNECEEGFVRARVGLMIALGGETSFDIYPIGWDKTYAMKHFKGYKIYFIGSRWFFKPFKKPLSMWLFSSKMAFSMFDRALPGSQGGLQTIRFAFEGGNKSH